MTPLWQWISSAFDASGFMPRWTCGAWTPALAWRAVLANALIWLAYWSMPVQLVRLWRARRGDIGHSSIMLMGGAFIFACGVTHLDDVAAFWWPAYRLFVLADEGTALLSVATAFALPRAAQYLIALPSAERLAAELRESEEARRAEAAWRRRAEDLAHAARSAEAAARVHLKILVEQSQVEVDSAARIAAIQSARDLLHAVSDGTDTRGRTGA